MGRPIGSILQVTLETQIYGQRLLNVLHYRVVGLSALTDVQAEQTAFLNQFNAVGQLAAELPTVMTDDATLTTGTAQFISATRFARSSVNYNSTGANTEPGNTANVTATFTKRTEFSGRWAVGSFHLAGMPYNAYANGLLSPAFKAALAPIEIRLLQTVTVATGGGQYAPCLYHKTGLHGGYTPLTSVFVQDQVRVMRRRTVGLGI